MLSYAGKAINLKCTEQLIPEFSELLFGRQSEGSTVYFDASIFTKEKGLSSSTVDQFLKAYEAPIDAIIGHLQLNEAEVCLINNEGHILIDSVFLYLFLSCVDTDFMLYMFDRMDDLFATGVAVSDTYLLKMTKARIPNEILQRILNGASKQ